MPHDDQPKSETLPPSRQGQIRPPEPRRPTIRSRRGQPLSPESVEISRAGACLYSPHPERLALRQRTAGSPAPPANSLTESTSVKLREGHHV